MGPVMFSRTGVLTASDTRSGQPVIMQLLPRGPVLPADLTLWALYQQRLGTGHPYIQQLQVRLTDHHKAACALARGLKNPISI